MQETLQGHGLPRPLGQRLQRRRSAECSEWPLHHRLVFTLAGKEHVYSFAVVIFIFTSYFLYRRRCAGISSSPPVAPLFLQGLKTSWILADGYHASPVVTIVHELWGDVLALLEVEDAALDLIIGSENMLALASEAD